MEISHEFIRRELDEIAHHNDRAMQRQSEALTRMVEVDDLSVEEKDDLVTGGLGRRRFLTFGAIAVATSAVFAACGSSTKQATANSVSTANGASGSSSATGSAAGGNSSPDVVILRTASSLENLAVQTYQKALASNLVTSAAVAVAAKNFMEQHAQHAKAFESATTKAGGAPFTQPNPVVDQQVITPALARVRTQTDVVALAYMLESAASQTYQSAIGAFKNPSYNSAAAEILGVESRHQALLGLVLADAAHPPYPPSGFQTDTGAVKAGTGVSTT